VLKALLKPGFRNKSALRVFIDKNEYTLNDLSEAINCGIDAFKIKATYGIGGLIKTDNKSNTIFNKFSEIQSNYSTVASHCLIFKGFGSAFYADSLVVHTLPDEFLNTGNWHVWLPKTEAWVQSFKQFTEQFTVFFQTYLESLETNFYGDI
jgi:hypothetical protein